MTFQSDNETMTSLPMEGVSPEDLLTPQEKALQAAAAESQSPEGDRIADDLERQGWSVRELEPNNPIDSQHYLLKENAIPLGTRGVDGQTVENINGAFYFDQEKLSAFATTPRQLEQTGYRDNLEREGWRVTYQGTDAETNPDTTVIMSKPTNPGAGVESASSIETGSQPSNSV